MFNTSLNDNRGLFFMWNLFSFAILVAAGALASVPIGDVASSETLLLLAIVSGTIMALAVKFCAYARRFNDLKMSRWHMVGLLIPIWSLGLWAYVQFCPSKSTDELA